MRPLSNTLRYSSSTTNKIRPLCVSIILKGGTPHSDIEARNEMISLRSCGGGGAGGATRKKGEINLGIDNGFEINYPACSRICF